MEESLNLARILRDLANRWGVTVLMVEHDMQVVFSICDRISVLHLGRSLSEGTCAEIRADPGGHRSLSRHRSVNGAAGLP